MEICGGIASGKTTLARLLARLEYASTLEDFQNNPFWKAFYTDPAANSFETEISFLLQHYHDVKTAVKAGRPFVCDFSPYLDLAYAHVTLSASKRSAFLAVYQEVKRELPPPTLLIHLQCGPQAELERIRRRGRKIESSITVGYLQEINSQLEQVLADDTCAKLVLDSELLDFANDDEIKRSVLETISQGLDRMAVAAPTNE
jgi:deoxyadenosine/deoxycytidine kinase